jgi:hypothetical protein
MPVPGRSTSIETLVSGRCVTESATLISADAWAMAGVEFIMTMMIAAKAASAHFGDMGESSKQQPQDW